MHTLVSPVLPVIVAGLLLPAQLMATTETVQTVLLVSPVKFRDQCIDTVIDTDIVAGSNGNRCISWSELVLINDVMVGELQYQNDSVIHL